MPGFYPLITHYSSMTIDGTNVKNWGMVPIRVSGGYDMPPRRTPYLYDWGDTKDILLGPTWKAWEPRIITVDFLFDARQKTVTLGANQVEAFIGQYQAAADLNLVLTDAEGSVGEMTVKVVNVQGHRKYRGGNERFTMTFRERVPAFAGSVPGVKSGGSISIDGYGLGQFSAKLIRVRGLSSLGTAKASKETVHNEASKLSQYREISPFTMSLVIRDNNPYTKLASLQAVLVQEKVLTFVYPGISFDCFCSQAFVIQKLDKKTIKFDMTLNRLT